MEEVDLINIAPEHLEKLCEIAEESAREYILSSVPLQRISDINIIIDVKGLKPIKVLIDLEIVLSPSMKGYDVQKLVYNAKKEAFLKVEKYLRKLVCK